MKSSLTKESEFAIEMRFRRAALLKRICVDVYCQLSRRPGRQCKCQQIITIALLKDGEHVFGAALLKRICVDVN